jgi:Caspase domain
MPSLNLARGSRLVIILGVFFLTACSDKTPKPPSPTTSPEVTVAAPVQANIPAVEELKIEVVVEKAVEPPPPPPPVVSGPYHRVLALVVGNNRYHGEHFTDLAGAENDAREFAEVLSKRFAFETKLLLGEEATAERVRKELDAIKAKSDERTDIIVYFAGHGITWSEPKKLPPMRRGFAIPYTKEAISPSDTLEKLRLEAIDTQALVAELGRWPVRHRLLILDACYSGIAAAAGVRSSMGDYSATQLSAPSLQVITAGTEAQVAYETADKRGLFTSSLIAAIKKAEEPQQILTTFLNARQKVVNSEQFKMKRDAGQPQLRVLPDFDGEFVLADLEAQADWVSAGVADQTGSRGANGAVTAVNAVKLPPPVPASEHQALVKRLIAGEPAGLNEADIERYETRAALGDAVALAILTEYYGLNADPDAQRQARINAEEAYDTGAAHGKYALGRAYEKGYGVEKDEALGQNLQKESELTELLALVQNVVQVHQDVQAIKSGDVSAIGRVLGPLQKIFGTLNIFSAMRPVGSGLRSFEAALAQDDLVKAAAELEKLKKALEKIKPKNENQRAAKLGLIAEVDILLNPPHNPPAREFYVGRLTPLAESAKKMLETFK